MIYPDIVIIGHHVISDQGHFFIDKNTLEEAIAFAESIGRPGIMCQHYGFIDADNIPHITHVRRL